MSDTTSSSPTTAEDMMATTALAVSPILTASIFDEIYSSVQDPSDDAFELGRPLPPPAHFQRRHTPLPRLETYGMADDFVPPPPSARWTRRLTRLQREENSEEADVEDHVGPVMPPQGSIPRSNARNFAYGQQCLNDRAYNTSPLLSQSNEVMTGMLDFDIIYDDGGQYGALYGIENMLLNDGSVYCSGRKGPVNILTKYCGFYESGLKADTNCSISKLVIKSPQHGFTAPCRDGMVFLSHKQINLEDTSKFDKFTKSDYEEYIANKIRVKGILDDTDPVAWFSLTESRTRVLDLGFRSAKYVLIKMLRADYESDNIDMQYIGFIGHSGPRSFGSAKFC